MANDQQIKSKDKQHRLGISTDDVCPVWNERSESITYFLNC